MTEIEKDILEDLLNEDLLEHIHSGYSVEDEYSITIRNLMRKFDIKERYNFDRYRDSEK